MDNLCLAIAFPILGSLSTYDDSTIGFPKLILAFLIVSMVSFVLPLIIPNLPYEDNGYLVKHLYPLAYIKEFIQFKWLKVAPLIYIKFSIYSFC